MTLAASTGAGLPGTAGESGRSFNEINFGTTRLTMARRYDWHAYDASMRNLQKAYAHRKKLGADPRPWRSKEESLMIRRLVLVAHEPRQREAILSGLA